MEDISDTYFRRLCKEEGADLMFTEFISIEGLIRNDEKSTKKLNFLEYEKPIGIQIFGAEESSMRRAVEIINHQRPSIMDINFGCPVKKVVCKGAGAAILKDIPKMVALAKVVVKNTSLPVTIKTRLGWDENSIHIEEVAERLQDVGVQALTIHGRTRAQMYKGKANWRKIAEVKNNPRIHIPIFGNGDVDSPEKALYMKNSYGLDGAMIGRAAIGNPWIFKDIKHFFKNREKLPFPCLKKRIEAIKKHIQWSIGENLSLLGRHYANYFKGLPHVKEIRKKLNTAKTSQEILDYLEHLKEKV